MLFLITLSLISSLILPVVLAADTIYFTAVNDEILPLKADTMPKYIGKDLYLPFTLFSSVELGVYFTPSSDLNNIMLYSSGSKWLTFDVSRGTVFDQSRQQYFVSAQAVNGTVYLPADTVCKFFGLTVTVIDAEPAQIVRVKTSSAAFNDQTFPYVSRNKLTMQKYYNEYTGIGVSASPDATPTPSSGSTGEPVEENYERVTVYLSFNTLAGGTLGKLLDMFDVSGYKCSFFIAADEIVENADLLRRAAGEGHTLGIWLKTGTYEEYLDASKLLFEAAKIRTLLVAAPVSVMTAAQAAAETNGLFFWRSTRQYEDKTPSAASIISKLSTIDGSRESLSFTCTGTSLQVITSLLYNLQDKNFSVRKITETSAPTLPIG